MDIKKLHKLNKMRSQMEKQMEQVWETKEKRGTSVTVNGNRKVVKIEIDGEENKLLKDLLNDAFKSAQKKAEKKMRSSVSASDFSDLL